MTIDALIEKFVVGQVAACGALGALAVEGEADGVHEGGFAAAIEAAAEDNGLLGAGG